MACPQYREFHGAEERREEEGGGGESLSFSYAMQLAMSSALSISLQCAIELGIFDIIAKAGHEAKLSPSVIAAHMPTTNPDAPAMLDRLLRLLASHSVLTCSLVAHRDPTNASGSNFHRLYGLAPVSKFFVTDKDGVSLGPCIVLPQDNVTLTSWSKLKEAILEGGDPFTRAHGTHIYEYLDLDTKFSKVFKAAMYNHSTIIMEKILELYKGFEPLKQLVDVGGGLGVNLKLITSRYPHINGINFDLPHVIKHAASYPGVEHVGGDMFVGIPSGDAIFMKGVLHNWNDEKCIKLLKNCYEAIPGKGKLIVVEELLPVMPETSTAGKSTSQMDVLMMVQTPQGKERSRQEFLALATAAGFSGIRFECFVYNFWVMEFIK
ncbi:caffeic acid 3-O-methyltransferase [Ziziphus jujuba]|uniref:caffeate O-methyltransferase n=1 Tax=Ziziphus jujuba TaxID=326968 RepID=A0A6P4ALI9_ZIZJJ|nr:caffeic acid 3-O-methyltransferase [Ziziphus jujuba]